MFAVEKDTKNPKQNETERDIQQHSSDCLGAQNYSVLRGLGEPPFYQFYGTYIMCCGWPCDSSHHCSDETLSEKPDEGHFSR
jgi:hypothetical protein